MLAMRVIVGAAVIGLLTSSAVVAAESVLFREGFEDNRLRDRGWYDGSKFTIVGAPVRQGQAAIAYHWQAGTTKPDNSSGIRRLFEPTDVVVVHFYLRLSKGWGWSRRPYHPHLVSLLTTENERFHGPAASRLTLYVEPHAGKLRLAAQDIQNKDAPHGLTQGPLRGGYNGTFFDSDEVVFTDAKWHHVKAMFKLNTLDLARDQPHADGIVRGWVDDKLVVEHTEVIFRNTDYPDMRLNQFLLVPYFGQGLLPHEQTLWIDELVVAVP